MKEIFATREKLFAPNDRVLGVHLRGTDYSGKKPNDYAIPPPNEFAVKVIVEKIRDWKCNKIFLATEDKAIIQFFKDTFGDGFGDFCKVIGVMMLANNFENVYAFNLGRYGVKPVDWRKLIGK